MSRIQEINDLVFAGSLEKVRDLVVADINLVNAYSDGGWTPLHLAAHAGHKAVAEFLLANGADVQAWSKNSLANQPLHAAAAGQQTELVALLLENGAEIDSPEHGGFTALHLASENGTLEMVKLLLAKGANPALKSDDAKTALDYAQEKGFSEVAELLK
jgi:ankyrin repeat protein